MMEGTAKGMSQRTNWTSIGTLPSDYRPSVGQLVTLHTPVIDKPFLTFNLNPNGAIFIQSPLITDNVWLQGTGVFAL